MYNILYKPVTVLLTLLGLSQKFSCSFGSTSNDGKCVKWGNTFDVSLDSTNIRLECAKPDGKKVCCTAVNQTLEFSRGIGIDYEKYIQAASGGTHKDVKRASKDIPKIRCEITKSYVSSPHELRAVDFAYEIEKWTGPEARFDKLLTFVTSEEMIFNSTKWLQRIKKHMQSEKIPSSHPDDFEYLSRFEVVKTCGKDNEVVAQWIEWIEPLTITARHPFGFGRCRNTIKYYNKKPKAGRSDTDYVLLQSGLALYNHTATPGVSPSRRSSRSRQHILMDAGTSTFDSSLFWFTCGYSQVYAWEKTLLEPEDYWKRVPALWKPFWHFYNVPISSDQSHPDSPLRLLKARGVTPSDFVAFKLDIDHPDTELPIALDLLSDPRVSSLIDEFFFEFHFRCEVMSSIFTGVGCGWGRDIRAQSHGFVLDRTHVLQFFLDLRHKGIRAHIWP